VRVGGVGPVAELEAADRLIDEEAEAGGRERGVGGELEPERPAGAGGNQRRQVATAKAGTLAEVNCSTTSWAGSSPRSNPFRKWKATSPERPL
jgi:hypothetical protein